MQRRTVVSAGLFLVLVAVGLAGADKPPPPGFLVWVLLAGVVSLVVWWRAPSLKRPVQAARDGAVVGLLLGILAALSPGEPSVQVPLWMKAAVVVGITALGALGGLLIGALLGRGRDG